MRVEIGGKGSIDGKEGGKEYGEVRREGKGMDWEEEKGREKADKRDGGSCND